MPVDIDVAGKPKRGAFAIRVIRDKSVIRSEANEEWRKLRIIRQLKFEIAVAPWEYQARIPPESCAASFPMFLRSR